MTGYKRGVCVCVLKSGGGGDGRAGSIVLYNSLNKAGTRRRNIR